MEYDQKNFFHSRIGKNRSIIAIARIFIETIFVMISKHKEFIDGIDGLTEKKMRAISVRARHSQMVRDIEEYMNRMKNVQKERLKRSGTKEKINNMEMIT